MMLFEPITVGKMQVKNRIASTPLVTRLASEDGFVTDDLIERYARLARGGIGWIITEAIVIQNNKSVSNVRATRDEMVPGLRRWVEAVHQAGENVKIGVQITHFLKVARSGWRQKIEDLTKEDIRRIVEDHRTGALRIRDAGFDSIEWDAESHMTLSEFLSRKNKRRDEYGGNLDNRMRLPLEIYHITRDLLGKDFTLGIRLNGDDLVVGGNTLLHSTAIARKMAEVGIDYISVSCGGQYEDAPPPEPGWPVDGYGGYSGLRCWPRAWMPDGANVYLAEGIRDSLRAAGHTIPVITAGKIPTPAFAESILQKGKADIIGMARSLLTDPDWPKKAKEGRVKEIVRCTYCDHCSELDHKFKTVVCIRWPEGVIQAPEPFMLKRQ
ncbi:MAG: NADH:flavin oxidoreductase [Chloroflexi bacterium]|nr:NADH:flavin oxidoreductase [Chloroflexota bacterium]